MDSQDHFDHDSFDADDTDAAPVGVSKHSESGDRNLTSSMTIEDTSWTSSRGINVTSGADVVFRNVSFWLNNAEYPSAWITVEDGATLVLDNCTIEHDPDGAAPGIRYLDGTDGNITNTRILNFTKIDIGNLASDGFTLYGNEFLDWSALQPIVVQGTGEVNITANEFTNLGDERLYNLIDLIDSPNATIVGNSFHDFGIKERGTFWATWLRGLIDADVGAIIANNTFENIGRVGSGGFYCINANDDNLTIDSNIFSNIRGFGLKIYGTEHLNVTGNLFRNMTGTTETSKNEYESSGAILVSITESSNGTGIIIEHNRIDNVAGAGIFQEKSNNITVRYNTLSSCNGSALRFGDEGSIDYGSFGKTYGNLFFENSIGIFIQNGSDNTFYRNAFINNDLAARDYNHTRNEWNNSAYGNLWFNDYQEEDSNSDWLGDTTPFNYDENITDNHPVFRIGELPPSSGVWEIEIPTVFQWNSISVPADIAVVNSTFGAFGVLNTTVNLVNNPTQVTIENNTVAGFLNATFTKGLSIDTYVSTSLQTSLIQGDLTFNGHDVGQQIEGSIVTGDTLIQHIDGFMMNDNYLNGTTGLQYISNCIADNNTFNDQLSIDDSIDCTFSNASLKGDLGIDGPSYYITFEDSTFDSLTIFGPTTINRDVHYITFDNCTFDTTSWQLGADYRFVNILDSTFYSGFDVTYDPVHNVSVLNNEFYLNGGTAVDIDGDNATVTGNYIVNSTNAIVIGASSNAYTPVVNENEIVNITGNGIDILTDASQLQIKSNWISNCSGFGIRAHGVSNHSVISNNYVELAGSYGIYIEAYPVGVHGYFSNVTHNVVKSCAGNGIEIDELDNSTIFNNTLTMNGGFGVVPTSCGDAAFWMNILYENDAGNIDGAGGMQFDNGTHGNFWGPSGPEGNDYYHGYDDGTGNPWIGDVPYEVASGIYDNYPLLHNQPMFLNNPAVIDTVFFVNFRLIVLNTTAYPQQDMWIRQGGNLTLVGTTIEFQSDASHVQSIIVETGCELRLIRGATITANNTQATYGFGLRSGARLVMNNASIYRCGYGAGNPGFLVNITTISFNNLRIGDSNIGMELYQTSLNVSNVRFTDCGVGLLVRGCSSCNISSFTFSNVDSGVQINSSSDCTVSMNDFTGCNDYGLSIDPASVNIVVRDNEFVEINTAAVYIASSGNEIYMNAFVNNTYHIDEAGSLSNTYNNGTFGNFYFDYDGVDDDASLIGDTPYSSAISDVDDPLPMIVYGSLPTPTGWTVDRLTIALNTNYTITGDVDVNSNLMLFDTRLWMNSSESATYLTITVYDGASLTSHAATIRAVNASHRFKLTANAGSAIWIYDTQLIYQHWLLSRTTDIVVLNTTFTNVYDGIALLGGGTGNITLRNCTVNSAEHHALFIDQYSNITIRDWVFDSVYIAIYLDQSADIYIENILVHGCTHGIRYEDTSGVVGVSNSDFYEAGYVITGNIDRSGPAEKLLVDGINAYKTETMGINCYYVNNATVLNSHIEMNGAGRAYHFDWQTTEYLLWNSYAFNGTYGAYVDDYSNGTINECDFYNFTTGVSLSDVVMPANLSLVGNLFYGCDTGLLGSGSVAIGSSANTFRYCGKAIDAVDSSWSSFQNNEFFDSNYGIYTTNDNFQYCQIAGNSYIDTNYPIYMNGDQDSFQIENETMQNCIDGITLYGTYNEYVGIDNITMSGVAGNAIYLRFCNNVLLSNLTFDNFTYGVFMKREALNVVMNASSFTNGDWAVHLEDPSLTMRDCTISGMTSGAFEYADLWSPDLYLDIDTSNTLEGLPIYSYFNVSDSVIYGHETYSLSVIKSSNVTLAEFEVQEMDDLLIFDSTNVTMSNSSIYADISVEGSNYTFIGNVFDNVTVDFINTMDNVTFTLNAFLTDYDFLNEWQANDFYLNGSEYGNYWYDYSGTDSDDDGIGDTPFDVTSAGETDYYPLMTNPLEYSVTISIYAPLDGVTLQGITSVSVNVDVDAGFYYEGSTTVSTIITVDGSEIGSGGEGDIEFSWNTTEHDDGPYTLRVTATVNAVEDFTEEISITLDNTGPTLDPEIEDGKATDDSSPSWRVDATDELSNLAWIAVYLDGSEVSNETASGQSDYLDFTLSLTEERSYELCLCSMDEVGNIGMVNLTIYYDITAPDLSSPSDFSYEEGATGNAITWTASDLTPSHYNVTVDGSPWTNGDWNGSDIEINVDGLDVGFNTVRIEVHDQAGNYAIDEVEVTVTVAGAPSIDHPADIEYDEGSTGHSITWNPDDVSPDSYVVFRNGSEEESGNWDGSSITVPVDGLGLGVYNFTIVVNNTGGYSVADIVFVTVVDGTPPTINEPGDIWFDEGDSGWSISWNPDDDHPASYEIFRNGTLVKSGAWNSTEETITISLEGLSGGVYNYTAVVYDVGTNSVSDDVIVHVIPDTDPPVIPDPPADINFQEGQTGIEISWHASDANPASYVIFRNGSQIKAGAWNSSSEPITISLDGLEDGIWNYTVILKDIHDQSVSDTVIVTVNPSTTTTTTTTTGTTETTTSTTTTGPPPAPLPIEIIIAIVGAVGAIVVVIVIVVMKKRK
ncbi:MAG: hypothetical protein GF309_09270 [Candidatus Lokiarchaeota archaeon]|nr:hypothetical protein [Candidatus Lokiarchaeota archaeon]